MNGGLIVLFVSFIFVLLGVVFIVISLVSRKKAETAQKWPTASGTVTHVEVREDRDYDSENGTTTIRYAPIVNYTYTVNGMSYSGNRLAFGANQFDQRTAQNKVSAYSMGSTIPVRYNPQKPDDSVLEATAAGGTAFLVVGIVFAVLGLFACCGGLILVIMSQPA